jgi:DNA-binding MarR family transcriptional regulator
VISHDDEAGSYRSEWVVTRALDSDGMEKLGPADEVSSLVADWRTERPDLDAESVRVFLPLRRAAQAAEARRAVILAKHQITTAMLDLMIALRRPGPPYVQTPSDLSRALVLSAGGVSQRLDRLEQAGLVERTVNIDDRRVVYVRLTDGGLKTLDRLMIDYMGHEEDLLHGLSARERGQLGQLLLRLEDSVRSAKRPYG